MPNKILMYRVSKLVPATVEPNKTLMIFIINKSSSSRQSRIGIREISTDWRSDRLRCRFFVRRPRFTPSDSWCSECQFQPLLETSQVQLLQSSYSKSVFYHVVSLFTSSQFSCSHLSKIIWILRALRPRNAASS